MIINDNIKSMNTMNTFEHFSINIPPYPDLMPFSGWPV